MTHPQSTPAKKNQRRARRQPAKGSTKVRAYRNGLGLGPNIGVGVLDISATGARLQLKEELATGREVEINLEGPGSRPAKLLANVAWCIPTSDGTFCVGVAFQKALAYADLGALARS